MASVIKKIREQIGLLIDTASHQNAASIATKIAKDLGLSGRMVDYTHVELRNSLNELRFKQVPYIERIFLLPHCLRKLKDCKASYGNEGLEFTACFECNKCQMPELFKIAEKLGYKKIACLPGGSMVEKLITNYKPKAVVGVACSPEIDLGINKLSEHGIPTQAVLLLKDGCKETEANIQEVREKLELIDAEVLKNSKLEP